MPLQTNDTPDHHDETAQSSVSLPQELIDHILDELREDIWSLEACSLVSHSFLRESRRLLFSRVEIWDSKFVARTGMFARIPRSFRGSGKLLGLLCESPSISLCIKDLKVIGSSWISDETHSLEAVLDMLLNLESISFKGTSPLRVNYGPPGGGQWLAKEIIRLKDSLVTVSQSPNLRRVSFDTHRLPDISKFFSMFNGSGLTHLSLDDVHFAEYQRPPCKCSYRLLSLRLDLPARAHAELIRCLLQYRMMIDIGHLRDLFIAVRHPAMFGTTKQLMDAVRGSLQHLRIRISVTSEWESIDLVDLLELDTVTFAFTAAFPSISQLDRINSVVNILSTIHPTAPLRKVRLDLDVAVSTLIRSSDREAARVDLLSWTKMDTLLTQPNMRNPRALVVNYRSHDPALTEMLVESMPLLNSRGLLQINEVYIDGDFPEY